ncbi:ER-Golgi trafficking TRAPP I complex 85 kDa subunit [Ceratobasidium sp. AG-Ba]|nr:ER-Golgi trafficking TRAPP I complex 85 kDa subunit [Ceratobasidium sp. AG-Ba]
MPWSLAAPSATRNFIPALPSLPPPPNTLLDTPARQNLDDLTEAAGGRTIHMAEEDLQSTNRFVREFVTQSLIPWMERNVVEWNEAYVATRRLPSRLFSTTRRFFGTSGSSTPVPSSPSSPAPSTAIQQRRLAEFATFLGDLKLATSVFDTLRKDTSNASASDILPLLLAPSKSLGSHALNALLGARFVGKDPSPSSQLRALRYAVRWERGISDLNAIGGDNWLVWAAGLSEEAPPALLLAQAAQILDKCGIKPLTMHFLRLARDLCNTPTRNLCRLHFSRIEHALGRLKYTTGDTEGAVGIFLGLLRSSDVNEATKGDDDIYLEDFKLALEHLISTSGPEAVSHLKLPVRFCQPYKTQVRVGTLDGDDDTEVWEGLEDRWKSFWKPNGACVLCSSGRAQAEEMFWVELSMYNPLEAEITLSDLTLTVDAHDGADVTVESLSEVVLRPRETRLLHMGLTAMSSGTLTVTHITYSFLSLLPTSEPLAWRGARMHATPQQRQGKVYAPDRTVRIEVLPRGARLEVELAEADSRVMCLGELRNAVIRIENPLVGGSTGAIRDVWTVMGEAGWPTLPQCLDDHNDGGSQTNIFSTRNTLNALEPPGLHDISALLVFRKEEDETFYTARMRIPFHVEPLLRVATRAQPSAATSRCAYSLAVEIENAGASRVQISQLSAAGIAWEIQKHVVDDSPLSSIAPAQLGRVFTTLESRGPDSTVQAIETMTFTTRQLRSILEGAPQGLGMTPPAVDVCWSYTNSVRKDAALARHFLIASRRAHVLRQLAAQVPLIPITRAASLVPLFGANDLDVVLEYNSENAHGFLFVHGLQLGGMHGELSGEDDVDQGGFDGTQKKKKGRSMYAETEREREAECMASFRVKTT